MASSPAASRNVTWRSSWLKEKLLGVFSPGPGVTAMASIGNLADDGASVMLAIPSVLGECSDRACTTPLRGRGSPCLVGNGAHVRILPGRGDAARCRTDAEHHGPAIPH